MNVLAVVCHPDDAECFCAGTLAKCIKRGDRVILCHASSGSLGHATILPDELRGIRAKEAQNAGAVIGAEVIWGGFDDLLIYDGNQEARDKMVDIIKYAQPDFIITHAPNDYMSDHTAVSKLVFDASFAATLPNYPLANPKYSDENTPPANLVPIYYMDTDGGLDFVPTEYVDISDEMDAKIEMLKCHKSQFEWIEEHDGDDLADSIKILSRFRGYQCGVEYAEGFRQCLVHLKCLTKRLLP